MFVNKSLNLSTYLGGISYCQMMPHLYKNVKKFKLVKVKLFCQKLGCLSGAIICSQV